MTNIKYQLGAQQQQGDNYLQNTRVKSIGEKVPQEIRETANHGLKIRLNNDWHERNDEKNWNGLGLLLTRCHDLLLRSYYP